MITIVLLPGMDGSGTLFDDFIAVLGAKAIVISYPPDRALSYDQLVGFVEERLPTEEPYILLGESFSGPIAIRVASKSPPLLRGVVLVCTFARIGRVHPPAFIKGLLARLPFWRLPVYVGGEGLLGRFNSAPMRSKLAAAIKGVAPEVWRTRLRSVLDVDVTSHLSLLQVPLLYLRATDDRVVPAEAAAMICEANKRAQVLTIEGPHALLQTNPSACASAVRDFALYFDAEPPRANQRTSP